MLGPDHRITLDTANDLGFLYVEEKRWKEAITYLSQAMNRYSRNSDTMHPARDEKALKATEAMIIALDAQGDFDGAERMGRVQRQGKTEEQIKSMRRMKRNMIGYWSGERRLGKSLKKVSLS